MAGLGFWRLLAVAVVKPLLLLMTRRTWRGTEHLPRTGGVIVVPNHISHADPFAAAHFVYENGRWPQFLGKASLFRLPLLGAWLGAIRQIPVYRGTTDAAKALQAAVAAVRAGDAVIIYPEGTITHDPQLWPMRGRTGVARLALETGAPVVPLAMWGPERIFDPRSKKLRLRPRTPVTVVAGPPVDLSRWAGAQPTTTVLNEITEYVMLALRDLLAEVRGETPPPLWTPARPRPVDSPDAA